jgi:hypothetical protein
MFLRPYFAKVLAPSAFFIALSLAGAGYSGCGGGPESTIECDENGVCFICDNNGCTPANPSVGQGGGGGGGGEGGSGGAAGSGGTGGQAPCDPNLATCSCDDNADCPADLLCIDGLCINACNTTQECGGGKVCVNGKCEAGCSAQDPCETGYACVKGYCEPDTANPQCTAQKPCPDGEICIAGICQTPCTTNSNCPVGEVCDYENGGCIPNPSATPNCGPDKPCSGSAQCGADGYCHYPCTTVTECKLIDSRFNFCDQNICKTEEEVNPECTLQNPCPTGKDCVSNKCL